MLEVPQEDKSSDTKLEQPSNIQAKLLVEIVPQPLTFNDLRLEQPLNI